MMCISSAEQRLSNPSCTQPNLRHHAATVRTVMSLNYRLNSFKQIYLFYFKYIKYFKYFKFLSYFGCSQPMQTHLPIDV